MTTLSISQAWNETAAFVKREAALLFPIALAFLAVPSIIVQFFMPATPPGQQPEAGPWMFLLIPLIVATMAGSVAITSLALRPGQSVGDAIGLGFRRLLPLLGAFLIVSLISVALFMPAVVIVGLSGLDEQRAMMVSILIFLAILTFIWLRVLLITPIAAAEAAGPVAMLKRSFAMTRGHFSKLILFATVFAIVAVIASLAVSLVAGTLITLVAGQPNPGSLSAILILIISGIVSAVVSVYFQAMIARIYAQLAGSTTGM